MGHANVFGSPEPCCVSHVHHACNNALHIARYDTRLTETEHGIIYEMYVSFSCTWILQVSRKRSRGARGEDGGVIIRYAWRGHHDPRCTLARKLKSFSFKVIRVLRGLLARRGGRRGGREYEKRNCFGRPDALVAWINTRAINTCIHHRQARMSRSVKSPCRLEFANQRHIARPKSFLARGRPSRQTECFSATRILFISNPRSYLGELWLQPAAATAALAMAFGGSAGGSRPAATSDLRKKQHDRRSAIGRSAAVVLFVQEGGKTV